MRQHDKTIEVAPAMALSELIETITSSPEEIFRIVVPSGAKLLRSEVGLKLLKEKSQQHNKRLVFMTDDEVGKILLARSGFIVKPITKKRPESDYFEALASGRVDNVGLSDIKKVKKDVVEIVRKQKIQIAQDTAKEKKKSGFSRITQFIPIRKQETNSPSLLSRREELPAITQPYIVEEIAPESVVTRRPIFLYISIFIAATALIIFLVSFFVLPSAKIEIVPKRTVQSIATTVGIAPSVKEVSYSTNELPGQFLELERDATMSFKTSGRKYVEAHTTGIIKVFNQYSSSPQTLIANTRFLSSDGKLFRTTQAVVIPGARIEAGKIIPSSIEVEIRADEAGDKYNIGPSKFTIPGFQGSPKFAGFFGQSDAPLSGGFIGETEVITEEDLINARRALEERIFGTLEQEWPLRVPKELKVLDASKIKQVEEIKFSGAIDTPGSTFQGTIKGSLSLVAFRESDLQALLNAKAEAFTDVHTKVESFEAPTFTNGQFNPSTQRFSVSVATNATIVARLDANEIVTNIIGKRGEEVRLYLASQEGIERAKITLWPFWSDVITDKPSKVRVVID